MADEIETKRNCAAYVRQVAWLRHTQPSMPDEQMDAEALQKVDEAVYGVGAKKDRSGNFIQQGIGHPGGGETVNHFAAIPKYEGKEAHDKAVAELWRRNPEHAKRLGLPQPRAT